MRKLVYAIALCVGLSSLALAEPDDLDYLGQEPPGAEPKKFPFEMLVPESLHVNNPLFSPDGKEFYFADTNSRQIYLMQRTETGWSKPTLASFSNEGRNVEPFITWDNKTLYFISMRPPGNAPWNGRIWRTDRQADNSWSAPTLWLDRETEAGLWYPNTQDGKKLYFGASLGDSYGKEDFYYGEHDGEAWKITHIGKPFSEDDYDWDIYVSPDGSYQLFVSRREGGFGETDIYVSFKTDDGFGAPINLGDKINSPAFETAASITPDGKYMFYTVVPKGRPSEVYWVSTEVITQLKP